jgi:hypothetical protein
MRKPCRLVELDIIHGDPGVRESQFVLCVMNDDDEFSQEANRQLADAMHLSVARICQHLGRLLLLTNPGSDLSNTERKHGKSFSKTVYFIFDENFEKIF